MITDHTDLTDKRKSGTVPTDSFGYLNMIYLVAPADVVGC